MANHFRRGFESQYQELNLADVPVEGALPDWLHGTIVRNGPGQFELNHAINCYPPDGKRVCYAHWFDGLAMPHRFTIREGRVSFANRYLVTETYTKDNATGQVNYRMSATDPHLSLWQRLIAPFYIQFMDNTNVHTALMDGEYVALTERTLGYAFDLETLETGDQFTYRNVPTTDIMTAHPHYDPKTNVFYNYSLHMGLRTSYQLYRSKGRVDDLIVNIPRSNPSYMHSFGMTEHYLVLAEYPFTIGFWTEMQFLFTEIPIFGNFTWNPQNPTIFTIVDKQTGEIVAQQQADPFFCFHHINAFERGDEVIIDVAAYADSTIIQELYLGSLRSRNQFSTMTADFHRYHVPLSPTRPSVSREIILQDKGLILPRINYNAYNTQPYRWTYGVSHHAETTDFVNQIVKIDVENGHVAHHWYVPRHYPSEPVFAPRPGGTAEDDGVVLSTVYDSDRDQSYLLVLDGKTFDPLATAYVPIRLPFAFHGRWYSDGVMY